MEDAGVVQGQADSSVFQKEKGRRVNVILVVYVDDILISGEREKVEIVKKTSTRNSPPTALVQSSGTWGVL